MKSEKQSRFGRTHNKYSKRICSKQTKGENQKGSMPNGKHSLDRNRFIQKNKIVLHDKLAESFAYYEHSDFAIRDLRIHAIEIATLILSHSLRQKEIRNNETKLPRELSRLTANPENWNTLYVHAIELFSKL